MKALLANRALLLLASICTMLVLAGQLGRFWPAFDFINAFLLPLLCVLLALVLVSLLSHNRLTMLVTCVGLATIALQLAGTMLGASSARSQGDMLPSHPVHILTLSAWHANPAPLAIKDVVSTHMPDIVVLQETDGAAAEVVDNLLPGFFRLKSCSISHCSMIIFSRWPLQKVDFKQNPGERLPDLLGADITAPFGTFRVINVHLPRPSHANASLFLEKLVDAVRTSERVPLIVAGDFNLASGTFVLASFAELARLRQSEGYLPTYPAHLAIPAFIAIDHVFVDARWTGGDCARTDAGNSDHHGIICHMLLRNARSPRSGPGQSLGALGKKLSGNSDGQTFM